MYEWTLGITDSSPAAWRSIEPLWNDECITASSSNSFFQVMNALCENAIKNRREYDHGINAHLWHMKIMSMKNAMKSREDVMMDMLGGGDDSSEDDSEDDSEDEDMGSDDEDDEDEKRYRGNINIQCPGDEEHGGYEDFDDPDAQVLSSTTKLSKSMLPLGHVIKVTYDYGTTTTLYLKVLSVKTQAVENLLRYFYGEADSAKMLEEMKAVPAYSLPKDKQVDTYFPYSSKAFLGYYVPLFKDEQGDWQDKCENKKVIGSVTMGLSAKHKSEKDTVFVTMETRTQSSDLLYCPEPIELNELLQVIDKAWEPRDANQDPDGLSRLRYDCISRWVVASDNEMAYKNIKTMQENESPYGPKGLLFRLPKDFKRHDFDFQKVFPKTHAMLKCGKFRWFQYKKGILRVIVGRGMGEDSRSFGGRQVLKTWRHDFASFHEILCAVEASWVWKGKALTADMFIQEFDTDLGPSCPEPKEPTCYGEEKDAVIIRSSSDGRSNYVTALALSTEACGGTVLYSGHDDGTLTKWSMDENKQVWSKKIYEDVDFGRYCILTAATTGVAGIVVRPDPVSKSNQSVIYTWSDYDTYRGGNDERQHSMLKVWCGKTGKFMHEFICEVGCDQEGPEAYPCISTVVFCPVHYAEIGAAIDSIIVGLHCMCNTLEYDESYSEFDLEEAQEYSEGNIVPFLENSTGRAMESWRGQGGMIRAMAVVENKYLASFSIQNGAGSPDTMVLWSLEHAGVPLFRKDFLNLYTTNRLKQLQTRMRDIAGISVEGKHILLTDRYGDRIVPVTVEEENGEPSLELNGFASIGSSCSEDGGWHGKMAMSHSKYSVVAMQISPTAWIFPIEGPSTHAKLDQRDGQCRKFKDELEESPQERRAAREIAVGKVAFPLWGGNKPKRKKRKGLSFDMMNMGDDSDGGPVQLAMRGRIVVAGFINGNLAKMQLPEQFEDVECSINSNHLACSSGLPSDEWDVPILSCEDD